LAAGLAVVAILGLVATAVLVVALIMVEQAEQELAGKVMLAELVLKIQLTEFMVAVAVAGLVHQALTALGILAVKAETERCFR
jgi:hypothetical protein